jgi:murein DD-endopeptidase MepM/ murein hydrolase activator NlpD
MLYAHLDEASNLQTGDTVVPGQLIGNVGTTGDSSATHLHLEIRVWSGQGDSLPIGPMHISEGPDTGYTNVHTVWHTWMDALDPGEFFELE